MNFNLAEKLAIVKDIDRVILADDKVAKGELVYLGQLMKLLDFDSDFVEEARKFNIQQANGILENMSEAKKHSLTIMLHEMAYADGEMSKEEIKILFSVFENVGIKIEEPGNSLSIFDVSDIYFKSSKNIQYKNKTSKEYKEKIAIKIEPNIQGKKGFTLTTFRLNGFISWWGNKVELAPKHMQVVALNPEKSLLKGYEDISWAGKNHSNYSLSIYHPNNKIEKIILHNHHKKIDVEYLK
ncbi:hypothetical protein [Christiangramia sediminis]|uniref:Co-chaperone DjlA N-terminal domain-containing protein n=1 Tax=Christiangramia sediminis TaxID=2881336 RepID=A0A9X1RV87_9FLAO|nr:hypothetical protein [Christiangramia sediminis]MCB7479854.1 hypothetical protein [Christiangramia sediminis]